MSFGLTHPEAFEPESARRSLAALVEQLLLETLDGVPGRALRVEMPVRRVDVQAWLRAQDAAEKVYWSDRAGAFEVAGIGAADTLSAPDADGATGAFVRLRERLAHAHPRLRYFGGARFDVRANAAESWRAFGAFRFVLPRFELMAADDQCYLACNFVAPEPSRADALFEEIQAELQGLRFVESADEVDLAKPVSRTDVPDREGWTHTVEQALQMLYAGALEKIVLARESRFDFPAPLDAAEVLRRLTTRVGRAFRFYFQPERGTAFLGASPERLYKRHGRHVESEAVAGTRPRGATAVEDESMSLELLASEKDVREHRFVVEALVAGFASLCGAVQRGDELSLLKLSECQHLYRRIEGILAETCSDAEILRVLHPTPAVGGSPKREAMEWIGRLEPFDRGWYAGPVGWVGRDAAEFAVALRCGLVRDASISVYSGAGIVPGSTPSGEWDEIEGKMTNLLRVLVGDDR
jgi:menaquinone-specific isochorismate synthase